MHWLCKLHDYPITYKYTDSGKGASRTPEFLAMSPIGKIPVLKDGDFVLTERYAPRERRLSNAHTRLLIRSYALVRPATRS